MESRTLSDIANEWMEYSEIILKDSTIVKYKNLLHSYILPSLGAYSISAITGDKVFELCNNLLVSGGVKGTGLSPKTVSDILSLLKNILKYAQARNMDVGFTACTFTIRQKPKQLRVFSIQEQQILVNYLKTDKSLTNLGIMLCLFTGIRVGELCALKWNDISFPEKTVHISKTMQRLSVEGVDHKTEIVISAPKSNCSIRTIPLPEFIINDLVAFRQADAFFLTGKKEKFIEPRTMQNRFKYVLKACHIANTNFHTLRHTFATRCVEVGFDTKSLSEILGHANVNITLNRYVHPTMELKRENMSKLSRLLL